MNTHISTLVLCAALATTLNAVAKEVPNTPDERFAEQLRKNVFHDTRVGEEAGTTYQFVGTDHGQPCRVMAHTGYQSVGANMSLVDFRIQRPKADLLEMNIWGSDVVNSPLKFRMVKKGQDLAIRYVEKDVQTDETVELRFSRPDLFITGLSAIRIFGTSVKHAEDGQCSGLKPVMSLSQRQEDALAKQVMALYNHQNPGDEITELALENTCSVNADGTKASCVFNPEPSGDRDNPMIMGYFVIANGVPHLVGVKKTR